jgi:tryptophan-rich hypothetical protein
VGSQAPNHKMPYVTVILRRRALFPPPRRRGLAFISFLQTMPKKQKFPHLVGSKWTALESTFGWRHFQVVNRKNQGEWVYAELVSSCDTQVRFWINAQILRDQRRWKAGWRTLQELGLAKDDPS